MLESASIGRDLSKNHCRGLYCESIVAQHYTKLGYIILGQRVKTPFAEVDLIIGKANQGEYSNLSLIEVKSVTGEAWYCHRISRRQRERLIRAYTYLQAQFDQSLSFQMVLVTQDGALEIIDDFLS